MIKPSGPFRSLLMLLQLMVVFVFLSYGGIAFIALAVCFMEAGNIVMGVLHATVWRAMWVFGRFAAGAALTICGGIALWSFHSLLGQIRKGTFPRRFMAGCWAAWRDAA